MHNLTLWISAFRLRTLPLALAVTGMGNLVAFQSPHFQWNIATFSAVTTLLLQILSNLANDYGDSIHGADSGNRVGPKRAVQSGAISKKAMQLGIVFFALLSLLSGVWLLHISFYPAYNQAIPLFLVGLMAIAAAYFYTNGARPYGYQALGDVSVFLFFGLVGVLGTAYLQTKTVLPIDILPAVALGLWSTAVLNINNMRDMESDRAAGKETIPIKLGYPVARQYQCFLVVGGMLCFGLYALLLADWVWFAFLPGSALMVYSLVGVWRTNRHQQLDLYLKPQALGTFLSVVCIALCQAIR